MKNSYAGLVRYIPLLVIGLTFYQSTIAQSNGDYQTRPNVVGNWNGTTTWQKYVTGAWTNVTTSPSSADGRITITNGATVNVTVAVTIDDVVIDLGGTIELTAAATGGITIANGTGPDFTVNGIYKRSNTANTITLNAGATIAVNSGGKYIHNVAGGSVPIATWASGSALNFIGVGGTMTAGMTQSFDTVNCNISSGTLRFDASATWKTLNIQNTGSGVAYLNNNSTGYTLNLTNLTVSAGVFAIAGSLPASTTSNAIVTNYFNQSGGTFAMLRTTTNATLTVNNSFNLSGGSFEMVHNTNNTSTNFASTVNIKGDFIHTAGSLQHLATLSGTNITAAINFNGTGTQNIESTGQTSTVRDFIFNISQTGATATVNVPTTKTFVLGTSSKLAVANNTSITPPTAYELNVVGRLKNTNGSSGVVTVNAGANVCVANGGVYEHNANTGSIPTLTWLTGSALEVTGLSSTYVTPITGFDQSFYTFTWNNPSQGYQADLNLTASQNWTNLNIVSTGADNSSNQVVNVGNSSTPITLTVANFSISGGRFGIAGRGTPNGVTQTLILTNTYTQTGGVLDICRPIFGTNTAVGVLDIRTASFGLSGGYIEKSGSGTTAGIALIKFNRGSETTLTSNLVISRGDQCCTLIGDGQVDISVESGTTLNTGTYTIGNTTGYSTFFATFNLKSGGTLKTANTDGITTTVSGAVGSIQVTGTRTYNAAGNYRYSGTAAQNTGNGLPATINGSFIIDNSSTLSGTGVTLSQTTSVSGASSAFNLTNGKLTTSSGAYLELDVNATLTGGSAASFVDGILRRKTNAATEYGFPVGDAAYYRPCSVIPNNNNAHTFSADYVNSGYGTYNLTSPLLNISQIEYWLINRVTGTDPAKVRLFWDNSVFNSAISVLLPTQPVDLTYLRAARWNGTSWEENDQFDRTGTLTSGSVTSYAYFSLSPFTFGGGGSIALPVEMLYFKAEAIDNKYIQLNWSTAVEINNAGFEIQRSEDGVQWDSMGWISGHNTTTETQTYFFDDQKVTPGIVYYYRLKQSDYDGEFEYSDIASSIIRGGDLFFAGGLFPNPANNVAKLHAILTAAQPIEFKLFDYLGRLINKKVLEWQAGMNEIELNTESLAGGSYIVICTSAQLSFTRKLIISK